MRAFVPFDAIDEEAIPRVGGKGASLGQLARAGLPVPKGFCISTDAYRQNVDTPLSPDTEFGKELIRVYQDLGAGAVAVRSSAMGEDGSGLSFAGQQETFLDVREETSLCEAVARCWASLKGERAIAYRKAQGVGEDGLAMAVVVQRLIEAEVAGVLFTRDPLDADGTRMLVEASWGLGESVVSGRVTPDRFQLDRDTGGVLERSVETKHIQITSRGEEPVPGEKQDIPCLTDEQLSQLVSLGRRVEEFFGDARDVEWALAEGEFWLLQARPITTSDVGERNRIRQEEIDALRALAEPSGTVWSKFNLAEVLPAPTPMTWDIVQRFMSGRGGFGSMYRDLGFDPDPSLDEIGIFDLVCGRPYCNLSREPRLHFRQIPFEHSFAKLKVNPARAMYPQPQINPSNFAWWFWLFSPVLLPWIFLKMILAEIRRQQQTQTFAKRFQDEIVPAFLSEIDAENALDYSGVSSSDLVEKLYFWIERTLFQFARDSLKPTALAALLMGKLKEKLAKQVEAEQATRTLQRFVMGVKPEELADVSGGLKKLAEGTISTECFLEWFGHRGREEMELSQPRWREDPTSLNHIAKVSQEAPRPTDAAPWEEVADEAPLWAEDVERLRTFVALRESAKHYLMKGYAILRRILLELDRRHALQGGIFYLTLDELPALVAGENFTKTIDERRRRRSVVLSFDVPPVLFSDDLEAIDRSTPLPEAETLQGLPISAGIAEAPALVLTEPTLDSIPEEPYILVCPSTDPAWVPLFLRAKGLVMETGGVLSHGAIVAREFGLPAVAGVPNATKQISTGQRVQVDGSTGRCSIEP